MNNRDIDKLVASKVMGWTEIRESGFAGFDFVGVDPKRKPADWYLIPHFLIEISAAWEVVETLEQRFECTINLQIHSRRGGMDKIWTGEGWERKRYSVTVAGGNLGYDSPNCSFAIYDNLHCVAICLAALKCVGVEIQADSEVRP